MKRLASLASVAVIVAGCGSSAPPAPPGAPTSVAMSNLARVTTAPAPDALAGTSAAEIAFAFDLDAQLFQPGSNEIIAPFSINEALAMAYAGANGDTHDAIGKVLHVTSADADYQAAFGSVDLALAQNPSEEIAIASSLWTLPHAVIAPAFLDFLATDYGAGVHLVDFTSDADGSIAAINGWVSDHTAGAIPKLLTDQDVNPQTSFVLTNALHFEGKWAQPLTRIGMGPFHAANGDVQVDYIGLDIGDALYGETDSFRAMELPYVSTTTAMLFLQPKVDGPSRVDGASYAAAVAALAPGHVGIYMPAVTLAANVELAAPLTALGMGPAFADNADFGGITPGVALRAVAHAATVSIDDVGTIASAATADVGEPTAGAFMNMNLDHPYFFAIRERSSGMILFLGHCEAPPASTN